MRQHGNPGDFPDFVKQRKSQDRRVYHDHPQFSTCKHLPQRDGVVEIHSGNIAAIPGGQFKAAVQWQGGVENPTLENGNIPRYLANTTLETYVQLQSFGSCLACHSASPTRVDGLSGNFSHLLMRGE